MMRGLLDSHKRGRTVTRTTDEVMVDVDAALGRLAEETRELVWDWDRRFNTAVGRVSDPAHVAVLALLDDCYAHRWDHENIAEAPEVVQNISAGWGGMRQGQLLYTFDAAESPLLFSAWWPWDSGTTFSMRVGCLMPGGDDDVQAMAKRLRSLFGA
jgi:hypothetical protein